MPNVHAVLIGCLLMGLFGVLTMKSAYRSVSWKSLVLIVGMLPFSLALQRTGGIDLAAEGILGVIGEGSPRLALAVIFMVTSTLGLFISNTATAVLMAPVALAIAKDLGRLALSLRNDGDDGGHLGVHDSGVLTGKHPGAFTGKLSIRGFRARGCSVHAHRADRRRHHGADPAPAVTGRASAARA